MKIPPSSIAALNNQTSYQKPQRETQPKDISPQKVPSADIKVQELAIEKVEKLKAALKSFNEILKPTHFEFQIHDESGRYFVKIVDDRTQEVIKQIPSEDFLQMVSETREQLGILMDQRI
jgi:flagellar protein FlaG